MIGTYSYLMFSPGLERVELGVGVEFGVGADLVVRVGSATSTGLRLSYRKVQVYGNFK